MKLHPRAVEKASHYLLVSLIIFEIFIVTMYLGSIWLTGKAYHPFDVDGRLSIPSLLQGLQIFTIGLIALILAIVQRSHTPRPSRLFYLPIAVLLFYASFDEIFKIYQQLTALFPGVDTNYWKVGYISILLIIPVGFYRDFRALWHFYRKETFLALLGMGIFVVGGLGAELFKHEFLQPLLERLFQPGDFMALFLEKFREAFEEFLEMLGESVLLYGSLLFIVKRLEIKHEQTD